MSYREGYETIVHDDGSATIYTIEHHPAQKPMPVGQQILWTVGITGLIAISAGVPIWLEMKLDRLSEKKVLRARQSKNKEIFDQLKPA